MLNRYLSPWGRMCGTDCGLRRHEKACVNHIDIINKVWIYQYGKFGGNQSPVSANGIEEKIVKIIHESTKWNINQYET